MAINITDMNERTEKMTYDIVPEIIQDEKGTIAAIKEFKKKNMESNGYGESRDYRHVAKIPPEIYWNFALFHGCAPDQVNEFYKKNNGKNMNKLLSHMPVLKTVDQL